MPFRALSSFISSADELLALDLPSLGRILLVHLKSYEGLNSVFQNGRLNRSYLVAIMENRNVGIGPPPIKQPEYGAKQPQVIRALMEAWNWLEHEQLLMRDHEQPADWFVITRRGEELLKTVGSEPRPQDGIARTAGGKNWDVFISHASEDRDEIARPLAEALRARGLAVCYDELSLKLGDSLRQSIDKGLAYSRFGIVIISRHFFEKHWPQQELNGLASKEVHGQKVIIPVWHKIGFDEVRQQSPTLANRLAVRTDVALEKVVEKVLEAISPEPIPKAMVAAATPDTAPRAQVNSDSDSKLSTILSYKGKSVTVESRQKYGHGYLEGFWGGDPTVADCNASYITLQDRFTKETQSFSLNRVEVSFDHERNRLLLEIER
jgi:hypothetical protein